MKNKKKLKGKVALVTGASSGIGKATSKALANLGADTSLAARKERKLKNLATNIGEKYDTETHVVPTDVRKEEEVKRMVRNTLDHFGRLDILVNNAGVVRMEV